MAPEKITENLGRYQILSELGQGAMGVVYKAIDPLIDRTVAIKTINLDLSRDELANFEERFYREAKSAGRINHPNIVTIYDVGKTDNIAYIAMEFLEGQSLKEVLDVHTPMSIDRIVDVAAQVADGLAYAHENGIVHRDIKPANIMLVRDNVVKITDFGIAQMPTGSRTLAGTILGSPKYMAPEQVVGKPVDGRSDLFSLGVVLYEMLTGETPFNGDNINTTMYRIVNEAPLPPKMITPRIPAAFNNIVGKALAKKPEERYQNAMEMAHDLRNYKDLAEPIPVSIRQSEKQRVAVRPKNNIGEETLVLSPVTDGQITSKAAIDEGIFLAQPDTVDARGPYLWQGKKILIAAVVMLVVVFTVTVMRSRTARQVKPALPKLTAVLPVVALAEKPAANPVKPDAVSQNSAPPQAEPLALDPPPPAPKMPSARPSRTPPHPSPKHKITTHETVVSLPDEPPQQSGGSALLSFAITPWGEVYVDGKKAGAAPPLKELKISAGKHVIEIRNLNFPPYSKTIDLQADSTKKIKYIFK